MTDSREQESGAVGNALVPEAGHPVLIGVGGSSASVASIERFFSELVPITDEGIVLVVQHREALDHDRLREALRKIDGIDLCDIGNGTLAEGGKVYLCPPDVITTLNGNRFETLPAARAPGDHGTIDSFLISLADHRAEQAIAVILHGTGGDGTLGVAAIKEQGGLTIAERTAGAVDHLSESDTPAALADFILPPEEIPARVDVYVRHLRRAEEQKDFDKTLSTARASLSEIADILRNRTGNDVDGYKQNTLLRRVQRRMQVVQVEESPTMWTCCAATRTRR